MARIDIDEIDNDDLATMNSADVLFLGWSLDDFRGESARVERVIRDHVMTGDDLTYWHDRVRIVCDVARVVFGEIVEGENDRRAQ